VASTHGVVLTYADLRSLPDDGKRYELYEGVLEMAPAPGTGHQKTVGNLLIVLSHHIDEHGLGTLLPGRCDVKLSEFTTFEPDLLFVAREREAIIQPAFVAGPPDLVVEVLSPTTAHLDWGSKRQLYAKYGIANYWLIEPLSRTFQAFVLVEGGYRPAASGRDGQEVSAPPFPELVIPLARLWA
jgi:Uma2 family endonuclease